MYHPKIVAQFGPDLFPVLGPQADRVPFSSFSLEEQQDRLDRIPVYVNTRKLGKSPTLVDVVITCLNELVLMGPENPLLGVELPCFDSLADAAEKMNVPAMNYDPTNLHDLQFLVKNAAKQRDVFLRHIFKDIIFRFNPGLVFPAIGRMTSKGLLFVNDGQHRTLACIILGIQTVPISFVNSDDEYWDVAQYATINIHSLSSSEYDKYRIRVQRYLASKDAGYPIEPEDELSYELYDLFEDLEITVIEKSDKSQGSNAKVLSGIGNMMKYRVEYGRDYFTRATKINAQLFSTCIFHTANSWGLMEFFRQQTTPSLAPEQLDYAIQNALRKVWKKPSNGGKMHSDIKKTFKEQTNADAYNARIPEPVIIAHGIWQICKKYEPSIKWQEPAWPVGATKFKMDLV